MTSPTTSKFSAEVRDRAVRMMLDHEGEHPSRCAAISSIAGIYNGTLGTGFGHLLSPMSEQHRQFAMAA